VGGTTTYRWTIDRTPPSISIAFPANSGSYNNASWSAGCAPPEGVCGTARDPSGVKYVFVSVRQNATGRYWNWDGFRSVPQENLYNFVAQTPISGGVRWSLAMPAPPDGTYTLSVIAMDRLGNSTGNATTATSYTFTVNTDPPQSPTIISTPDDPTTQTSATFAFTDTDAGVTFLCSLDTGSYAACASGVTYSSLSTGTHTFYVEAEDATGNVSPAATYSWHVVSSLPFTITGNATGTLYPGWLRMGLTVTLSNPNSVPISVTSLTASVDASRLPAGCNPDWFNVVQSNVSASQPETVPANGSVTLPDGSVTGPSVRMIDTNTNQDACQGATVTFDYTGSAHS
jgi:hypothetical protein